MVNSASCESWGVCADAGTGGGGERARKDPLLPLRRPHRSGTSTLLRYYSRAYSSVIHKSMSLEYESSSEPLHIYAE